MSRHHAPGPPPELINHLLVTESSDSLQHISHQEPGSCIVDSLHPEDVWGSWPSDALHVRLVHQDMEMVLPDNPLTVLIGTQKKEHSQGSNHETGRRGQLL